MAVCGDAARQSRLTGVDESNILTAIIAAVSLGALGLVVAQMSLRLDTALKSFGVAVAGATWAASILLVLAALWRHFLDKRGVAAKRTDVIFYASVAAVMCALAVAMLWLALAGLSVLARKK